MRIHTDRRPATRKPLSNFDRDESAVAAREPLLIDLPLPLVSVSVAVPAVGVTVLGGGLDLNPTAIIPLPSTVLPLPSISIPQPSILIDVPLPLISVSVAVPEVGLTVVAGGVDLTAIPSTILPLPSITIALPSISLPSAILPLPSISIALPSISLPSIDLPLPSISIALPSISLPSIDLPLPSISIALPSISLPSIDLPLPSISIPLPSIPLTSTVLPLPSISIPLPSIFQLPTLAQTTPAPGTTNRNGNQGISTAQPTPTPDAGTQTATGGGVPATPAPSTPGEGRISVAPQSSTVGPTASEEGESVGSNLATPTVLNAVVLASGGIGGSFVSGIHNGFPDGSSGSTSGIGTASPTTTIDPNGGGAGDHSKGGLSRGVIAAIVIVCLFLLAGILAFLRRRFKARRDRRAHSEGVPSLLQPSEESSLLRASSVYTLTTISDRSRSPAPSSEADLPAPPPTAEMATVPQYDINGRLFPVPRQYLVMNDQNPRTSVLSDSSRDSDLEANNTFTPSWCSSQTTYLDHTHSIKGYASIQHSLPVSIIPPAYRPVSAVPIPPNPFLPKSPPPVVYQTDPFADNNPFDDPSR